MSEAHHDETGSVTPLELEAHDWVRRIASRQATAADADRLRQWRAQSPAHERAFQEATQLWRTFGSAAQEIRADEARAARQHQARRVMSRRMVLGGALAASVAGVAVVRPPLDLWPSVFELKADFRTGTGEQREINLPEAASVQMNTRTSISMKGAEDARTVELVAGEASFRVMPEARSFQVIAADGRTRSAGGRFDVRVDGSSVCVTCYTDKVEVSQGARSVGLGQGQRVVYDSSGVGDITRIDPAVAGAWHDGLILCRNTPLSEFVTELNRYRSGRIVLVSSDVGRLSISGRFSTTDPDQALVQIQKAFGVRIRNLPGGLALVG
jgi:transmembrane sensor